MRYRKLDTNGDYSFGKSSADFFVNSPETVAQAVQTRLRLLSGEWFLDVTEGTPYSTEILGTGTQSTYDEAVRERVLGTQGVEAITAYSSYLDTARKLSVEVTITTIYGSATVSQVL